MYFKVKIGRYLSKITGDKHISEYSVAYLRNPPSPWPLVCVVHLNTIIPLDRYLLKCMIFISYLVGPFLGRFLAMPPQNR